MRNEIKKNWIASNGTKITVTVKRGLEKKCERNPFTGNYETSCGKELDDSIEIEFEKNGQTVMTAWGLEQIKNRVSEESYNAISSLLSQAILEAETPEYFELKRKIEKEEETRDAEIQEIRAHQGKMASIMAQD